jgi:hypothetical protein
MHTDPLIEAFVRACQPPPDDLTAAVTGLPPVGTLPSQHGTWTLIRLVRYRDRQRWAHERLLDSHDAQDVLAERDTYEEGMTSHPLPDLPGWQLDLYGGHALDYAYLRHRDSGEEIFLDLSAVKPEDGFFCMGDMMARRDRGHRSAAEGRLAELHPVRESLFYSREELLERGYLEERCFDEDLAFYGQRLSSHVAAADASIASFAERWEDPASRLWLAALIGDWPAAAAAAERGGYHDLIPFTRSRADQCHERWAARVCAGDVPTWPGWYLDRDGPAQTSLAHLGALRDASPRDFTAFVQSLLDEVSFHTGTAVEFLAAYGDGSWCGRIAELFRVAMDGPCYVYGLRQNCARYLARHGGSAAAVIDALASAGPPDEAAFLALDYAPAASIPLLRRALRSPSEEVRGSAAGALAVVDRPWSRRELTTFLESCDDHKLTWQARAALLKSPEPEMRQAVAAWDEAHRSGDGAAGADPGLDDEGTQYFMDRVRDRALDWRARYPEEVAPIA